MPPLRHIVAAVAPEAVAGSALRVARALADATGARLTSFSLADDVTPGGGVIGIEIPRFAESVEADLVVLPRMLVRGELLADAVTRRSRVPSLVVSPGQEDLSNWLIALDGSPRCPTVLSMVTPLVEALGATAVALTVEPSRTGEAGTSDWHLTRTLQLSRTLEESVAGSSRVPSAVLTPLRVRHGDVVTEVLREREALVATVLAIGSRPGGPPPPIPEGSMARRLVNDAPCIVLTVPL